MKTLKITKEAHEELSKLKYEFNDPTLSEAIMTLIKFYKLEKGKWSWNHEER